MQRRYNIDGQWITIGTDWISVWFRIIVFFLGVAVAFGALEYIKHDPFPNHHFISAVIFFSLLGLAAGLSLGVALGIEPPGFE